ncbi:uncharacterized protein METZ01_LOCUS513854 [marine metagenome]|uniref:Uncharacterized protein n=1 Tax=marine metagenome TaxID=408172 RepID=A0A383EXH8_9ZZZZ
MQLTIERIEHESAHSKKPLTEETIGQPDE